MSANMLLVLDLEATCDNPNCPSDEMEIIEAGACWVTPQATA